MFNNKWKTFDGKNVNLSTIDHQHLSNCFWYAKIIKGSTEDDLHHISAELTRRFNSELLPYRPNIAFEAEISELIKIGCIQCTENSAFRTIVYKGKIVGEIWSKIIIQPVRSVSIDKVFEISSLPKIICTINKHGTIRNYYRLGDVDSYNDKHSACSWTIKELTQKVQLSGDTIKSMEW